MQAANRMFCKFYQIFTIILSTAKIASSARSHILRSTISMTTVPMPRVVVLGAGIHGASVAYYLSTKFGILPTVVERVSVAAAASGKAGGFLAREWGTGATVEISRVSFDMHEHLAAELNVESYRHVKTLSVDGNRKGKADATWLDRQVASSVLDSGATTAQVTPLELTTKLMDAAIKKGTKLVMGAVEGIDIVEGKVVGVRITGQETLPADKVVMCLGPWSGVMAEDWFGMTLPMEGVKSTSVVYKDLEPIRTEPFACFCAEDINDCHLELYPRPNGEIYLCGAGGSQYVKGDRLRAGGDCESADMIVADPKRVKAAGDSFRMMSSLGDREPDQVQACMRPCPSDGLPVMGKVPQVEGAYISCGHNCWGILWAPASGLAVAELMATGASTTLNLQHFSPDRFDRSGAASRRGKKKGSVEVGEQW